jgi:gamma-tubulin complex component 5
VAGGAGTTVTLLSLLASMSRVFAGAEFLKNVLQKAVPLPELFLAPSSSGAEIASHILSSLYEQLDESCLLQDGEEEGYRTLLLLFVGTLRPLSKSLDAWLQEGTLSDPSGELFFYANISVPIEDARFWQQGYQMCHQVSGQPIGAFSCSLNAETGLSTLLLEGDSLMQNIEGQSGLVQRTMDQNKVRKSGEEEGLICPAFLRSLAKDVVSAGKSLQLLQHIQREKTQEEDCGYSSRASGSSTSFPPTPFSPAIHGPWKKFPSEVPIFILGFSYVGSEHQGRCCFVYSISPSVDLVIVE